MWVQHQPGQLLPGRQRRSWKKVENWQGDDWEAWVCVAQGLLLVTRRNQCPGAGRDSGIVYCSDSFANVSAEQTDMILSTHFMFTFGLGEVSFSPLAGLKSYQGTLSFLPCLPPAGEFP